MIAQGHWLPYDAVPDWIRYRHHAGTVPMASRYQVVCDACGAQAEHHMIGWVVAFVHIQPRDGFAREQTDFCPDCWKAMRVISRERRTATG
jgi:hypothetical protein